MFVWCLCLATVTFLYIYLKSSYTFWSKRGVYNPPTTFPFGNVKDILMKKKSFLENWRSVYEDIKGKNKRLGGGYTLFRPILIPTSADFFRLMLSKNFDHFQGRGLYSNEKEPLTIHLVNLDGEKWKTLRTKLTPTFSSAKLKNMFYIFLEVSRELEVNLMENVKANRMIEDSVAAHSNGVLKREPVDIKNLLDRYTIDVIGRCAFGIECNSLRDPENSFYKIGLKVFQRSFARSCKEIFASAKPGWFKASGLRMFGDLNDFYIGVVEGVISDRKTFGVRRGDFMDTLLEMLEKGGDDGLNFTEVVAQAFVFFAAGFETSATTMTFVLLELALNQKYQDKVREEALKVLPGDKDVAYEDLGKMEYLECVIKETLRKYPPFPIVSRKCTKSFVDPESGVTIPEGVICLVPIYCLHHDEEYFPNPDVFDPERFSQENKKNIVPFSYIPFGEGPRLCIGMKFAMIQMKSTLAKIISKYKFSLNERTPLPIKFKEHWTLSVKGNVWLDVESVER